jgi:hypothetical protein
MSVLRNLPNGSLLLSIATVTYERLQTGSKAAIALPFLREILIVAVSKLPFDEEFYLSTYPDLRAAYESGDITDLQTHFAEAGYFEGRFGAKPNVDEEFYKEIYPDVAAALANNDVGSALEHYMRAGAREGRFATPEDRQVMTRWLKLAGRM